MEGINSKCFVCGCDVNSETATQNRMVNLPVCKDCKGTDHEKQKTEDLLDGMADGFVCGCI